MKAAKLAVAIVVSCVAFAFYSLMLHRAASYR